MDIEKQFYQGNAIASAYCTVFMPTKSFPIGSNPKKEQKVVERTYKICTCYEVKMFEKGEYFRSFAQDAEIALTTRREMQSSRLLNRT